MELQFYTDSSPFYDEGGQLKEEPEESLEELLTSYDVACAQYSELLKHQREAEAPYRKTRWIGGVKPDIIEDRSRNCGHVTCGNALWSDITLAFAADFSSPGEISTGKAAGDKLVPVTLPCDIQIYRTGECPNDVLEKTVHKVASLIVSNPHYRQGGIRLNITGNDAGTLRRCGITDQTDVDYFVMRIISSMVDGWGVTIGEIRSGGQTGAEEAGIKAAQRIGIRCSILAPAGFRMRDADGTDHEGRREFEERFRESYVDYDEWDKKDPEGCWNYGLCEFNGYNGIEMLEYEIDLKIMHINKRKL